MVKVSILMNGYNGEKYLKEAIDSIYAQTYKNWEIIFIDNCSTDSTKEILNSYDEKIKYHKTEQNIPLGAARVFGINLCKSKYIAFLDTDDIWLPNKLELQVNIMDHNHEYAYCYTDYELIDESGQHISYYKTKHTNGNNFAKLLSWYEVGMSTVMIRANMLKLPGDVFDTSLSYCPDYDLFMRLAIKYKICSIKKNLFRYRVVQNSLTNRTKDIHFKEIKYVSNKLLNIVPNMESLYPNEYSHWRIWMNKVEADYHIMDSNLRLARLCLKQATALGERHKKRYEMSLQKDGLKMLQEELKKVDG